MARHGKVNTKEIEDFMKKLQDSFGGSQRDAFMNDCAKELAARLLAKVRKRTPVGVYPEESGKSGGTLRRNWTIGEIRKVGDYYEVEVINPTEYASYVEYGHRQTPGRFVPAIGKKLKKSWVEGKFMLTISAGEVQKLAPKALDGSVQR